MAGPMALRAGRLFPLVLSDRAFHSIPGLHFLNICSSARLNTLRARITWLQVTSLAEPFAFQVATNPFQDPGHLVRSITKHGFNPSMEIAFKVFIQVQVKSRFYVAVPNSKPILSWLLASQIFSNPAPVRLDGVLCHGSARPFASGSYGWKALCADKTQGGKEKMEL